MVGALGLPLLLHPVLGELALPGVPTGSLGAKLNTHET